MLNNRILVFLGMLFSCSPKTQPQESSKIQFVNVSIEIDSSRYVLEDVNRIKKMTFEMSRHENISGIDSCIITGDVKFHFVVNPLYHENYVINLMSLSVVTINQRCDTTVQTVKDLNNYFRPNLSRLIDKTHEISDGLRETLSQLSSKYYEVTLQKDSLYQTYIFLASYDYDNYFLTLSALFKAYNEEELMALLKEIKVD